MRIRSQSVYLGFVVLVAASLAVIFVARDQTPLGQIPLEAVAPNVSPFSEYHQGKIVEIVDEQRDELGDESSLQRIVQTVRVTFVNGHYDSETTEVVHEVVDDRQTLSVGDKVVLAHAENAAAVGTEFVVVDVYRLPAIALFAVLFVVLAITFGRARGFTALLGLAFSIVVLLYFVAPQILTGADPATVTMLAAAVIASVSIFLAHGFKTRTTLAVVSTLVVLAISYGIASAAIQFFHLFGNGSEETFLLQATSLGALDLQGLLLASVIIGTLGILDDVTTAQTAAVEELHSMSTDLSMRELYTKAMSIGKEHIASLVNTIVLVYAGAFFPLFLVIVLNAHQPVWVVLNSEFVSEEIVRTLVGSTALVLAVPISSVLAAWYYARTHKKTALV